MSEWISVDIIFSNTFIIYNCIWIMNNNNNSIGSGLLVKYYLLPPKMTKGPVQTCEPFLWTLTCDICFWLHWTRALIVTQREWGPQLCCVNLSDTLSWTKRHYGWVWLIKCKCCCSVSQSGTGVDFVPNPWWQSCSGICEGWCHCIWPISWVYSAKRTIYRWIMYFVYYVFCIFV